MNDLSLSPMRMSRPVLFYDELSPMSRSVLMLIELARLDVDIRFVDLTRGDNFREEFVLLNPTLTVPVLVHDDQVYIGSAILFYLCDCTCSKVAKDIYPNNNCTRNQILNRLYFESSMLARRHSDIMSELMGRTYTEQDMQRDSKKIYHMYDVLESYLCGASYMVGNSVTIADIAIVSTLLGLDLIFPIVRAENPWPRLSKWITDVSTLRGYNHILKGVDRQRWVVETAGQFQFSAIRSSPDMLQSPGNNTKCQKEFVQYPNNCKSSSTSENMTGILLIPPMTDVLDSRNSPLMDQQGNIFCYEPNCLCIPDGQQQQPQSCNIKSIIATANKPKTCNCVRIFEDLGCDMKCDMGCDTSPRLSARDENVTSKNCSKNLCDIPTKKERYMNSKKESKNLSDISVIPVTELPCYSKCDSCDCSFKPPLDKNRMEESYRRSRLKSLDQDNNNTKQKQTCEGACRNCGCNPESALCPVFSPCENSQQSASESLRKSISCELSQRVQKQTAYNTDQNCLPLRTNLLNKNSDSMFSFNTNLFQSSMCQQHPPYQKQASMSMDTSPNNYHMYERKSFCCPTRAYNRLDDGTLIGYQMSYPNSLTNDSDSGSFRRSPYPSQVNSMYPMAGSIYHDSPTCSFGYSPMPMNENGPFYDCNMRTGGYGNHSEFCPLHFTGHDGLNQRFNMRNDGLNMMTEGERPIASQVPKSSRISYPTDYNEIINSNRRKRNSKPIPPPPPPPPSPSACGCTKPNANNSENLQAEEKRSTLILLKDDTIDQIKPAVADSPNADENALAKNLEDSETSPESDNKTDPDDLTSSRHKSSTDLSANDHQIRISVVVQGQHEHHKRPSVSREKFEHETRFLIPEGQSEQQIRSSNPEELSGQEKRSSNPEELSGQEKRSSNPEELSGQERQSLNPEELSGQEKRSSNPEELSGQEKRSSNPEELSGQEAQLSVPHEQSENHSEQNERLLSRQSRASMIVPTTSHGMSCSRRNLAESRMSRHTLSTIHLNTHPEDDHKKQN